MTTPSPESKQNGQAPETDLPAVVPDKKKGDDVRLGIGIGLVLLVLGVAGELIAKGRFDGMLLFSVIALKMVVAIVLGIDGRRRLGLGLVLSLGVALMLLTGGCMLLMIGLPLLDAIR